MEMTQEAETARNAAKQLSDFVNNMGHDANAFAEELCHRTHRTLQQQCMSLFAKCIEQWAKDYENKDYDGRNEQTVTVSKEIMERCGEQLYFPFI